MKRVKVEKYTRDWEEDELLSLEECPECKRSVDEMKCSDFVVSIYEDHPCTCPNCHTQFIISQHATTLYKLVEGEETNIDIVAIGDTVDLEDYIKYVTHHLPIFKDNMERLKTIPKEQSTIEWGRTFARWMDFHRNNQYFEDMGIDITNIEDDIDD